MCRSIVVLRGEEPPTEEEIVAAATQYVRKVSGSRSPSQANVALFDRAVRQVAAATRALLDGWESPAGSRAPAMATSRLRAREKSRMPSGRA